MSSKTEKEPVIKGKLETRRVFVWNKDKTGGTVKLVEVK